MANFNWPVNPSSTGPVEFIKDGSNQVVIEDTATPANSEPLPIKALDSSGQAVDFSTAAKQDSQTTELQSINSELDTQSSILSNIEAYDAAIQADLDSLNARLAGSLVPETFDYQAISYVASGNGAGEVETITYKTGGAGGTTVATVTLAYDSQDRVISVTRS